MNMKVHENRVVLKFLIYYIIKEIVAAIHSKQKK